MIIRHAAKCDLPAITDIYNDAVANTTAIWNETLVDQANRLNWLSDHQIAGLPVLVAVDDEDNVLGYATFGPWRAWEGYRHTVEHSVYVHKNGRRKGVGRALMLALLEQARILGKHVMIAEIESQNEGSIRLHEALGFEITGHCKQVGCKFGRWLDLTFMQINLDGRELPE